MIIGVTATLGAGKTAFATQLAITSAKKHGLMVASNIKLSPPVGVDFVQLPVGDDGFDLDALYGLRDQVRAEGRKGLVLLLDEVGLLMPARFWATFPVRLLSFFTNSRKVKIIVIWTSQDELDVESILRRRTQYIFRIRRFPPSDIMDPSRRRPVFLYVTRWLPGQADKQGKRLGRQFLVWRREWEQWFDTDEIVEPSKRIDSPRAAAARKARQEWA